jgi:UPF0755 protein
MKLLLGVFRYHIVVLAVISLLFSYFVYSLQPVSEAPGQSVEIAIGKGVGAAEVFADLERRGIIRSARAIQWYAVVSGSAHLLKPGFYRISSAEGGVAIIEKLVAGPRDIVIPIIEGSTLKDVDAQLSDIGIVPAGSIANLKPVDFAAEFPFLGGMKSLEGFLLPDTYHFALHSDPKIVAARMLENFRAKAAAELGGRTGAALLRALTIASLVEKEVPEQGDDRVLVAGIIERRLAIGMGLQIDATVLYAKCGARLISCPNRRLSRDDFQNPSPYNTYVHRGLPPTPIANPGLSAIRAALNPKKSDYLFYLSDPKTRRTIFSRDFDEHNDNRARYLGL